MRVTRTGAFYGWRVTGGSFVILLVSVGVGLYVPPVFLVPLEEQFGWSRAAITTGGSIAALTSGLASPLVGFWVDRQGPRTVMAIGAVLLGAAFASFALVTSLWQLYALNAIAAAGLTCTAWVPNQTLISNWFERKRGLAMGVALMGIGVGGLFMAPLAGWLVAELGWRAAFATLGSLVAIAVAGISLTVVRTRPADLGLLPDGETADDDPPSPSKTPLDGSLGLHLSGALRTRAFWLLSSVHLLWVFGNLSIIGHLVAFLSDRGAESQAAAGILGLTIGISVAARLVFGWLADRFAKRAIMTVALLLHVTATIFLLNADLAGALPAFVVFFGMGLGGGAVLVPLLVGECFGLLAFAKILGLVMISGTLGAAIGPVLTGLIYDVTGSYRLAFVLHLGAYGIAAVTMLFVHTPRGRT